MKDFLLQKYSAIDTAISMNTNQKARPIRRAV